MLSTSRLGHNLEIARMPLSVMFSHPDTTNDLSYSTDVKTECSNKNT